MLNHEELTALFISLKTGALSTLISFPGALFFGWLLARREFPGKTLVDGLVNIPLIVPPVTSGYILLQFFSRKNITGLFIQKVTGLQIPFSFAAVIIAASFVAFPLYVRSIRTAMEMADRKPETAAAVLGRSPGQVFFTITLPLILPGIVSGSLLCFARSLGEFGATMTFAGNIKGITRTIPLAIHTSMQIPGQEGATFKLVLFSLGISLGTFFLGEFLKRRYNYGIKS